MVAANAVGNFGRLYNLAKPLVAPVGATLTAVTAAGLAAPVVQDLYQWSGKRRKEINRMTDLEFEDYEPDWFDNLALKTGDKANSSELRDEYITKGALKDDEVILARRMLGTDFVITPGYTADQLLAQNNPAYKKALAAEKISGAVTADNALYGTDRQIEERRRADQDRLDLLSQQSNNLEYQRSRDRRADMQYNENLERLDRKDRRTAISSATAGLAALAAAFAI